MIINEGRESAMVERGTIRHVTILVRCAAKLAFGPVGESPAGGNCPVATVVISGNGEGDRAVESPEVRSAPSSYPTLPRFQA